MKFLTGFEKAEKTILGGCAFGAAILSYMLAADITMFYQTNAAFGHNKEPLATLASLENDVRYSPSSLPVWTDGLPEQNLFRNDKIFTEEESSAEIKFDDNNAVSIDQNSLVIIDRSGDSPTVNLIKGSITTTIGRSNSDLQVFNNGERLDLQASRARVRISKLTSNSAANIQAVNGPVYVNQDGDLLTVNKGESLRLGEEGVRPLQSEAIDPQRMNLRWSNPDNATVTLQVSSDPDFEVLVLDRQSSGDQYVFTSRRPGTYYWRVIPLDEATGQNAVEDLSSLEQQSFDIEAPPQDSPIELNAQVENVTRANGRVVNQTTLAWSDPAQISESGDEYYEVQLSRNRSFPAKATLNKKSASENVEVTALRVGKYFWRVRKVREDGSKGEWSQVEVFDVGRPAPKLDPMARLKRAPSRLNANRQKLMVEPGESTEVTLSWNGVAPQVKYEVEVSDSQQFAGPPLSRELTVNPRLNTEGIVAGTYYWRVRTVLPDGTKGKWSLRKSFVIQDAAEVRRQKLMAEAKKPPVALISSLDKPIVGKNDSGTASLKWREKSVSGLGELRYEIATSSTPTFNQNVTLKQTSNASPQFDLAGLKAGQYYWKIRTILPDGERGAWSQVESFNLRAAPTSAVAVADENGLATPSAKPTIPLPPAKPSGPKKVKINQAKIKLPSPVMTYPVNKSVIDIKGQKLEWQELPGAQNYTVEVFDFKNPKKAIKKKVVKEPSLKSVKLKPGKYLWRVVVTSKDKIKTRSKKRTFVVKDIASIKALEPLKPDASDRISTSSIAAVVDFEWLKDPKASEYQIEVSMQDSFLTTFFSQKTKSPVAKFNFPQGSYFWRVTSYDAQGQKIKTSKTYEYSVAATMGSPKFYGEAVQIVNIPQPADVGQIDLAWSVVPKADRYELEVASDKEFNRIQLSNSQLDTRLPLSLESGKYYARVRAVDSYGFESDWSEVKSFDVKNANLPKGPKLRLPSDGGNFVYRRKPTAVVFRWKKDKKFQEYEFELAADPDFTRIVKSTRLKSNKIIEKLEVGDYSWRVRAFDKFDFATDWSETRAFAVNQVEEDLSLTYPVQDKRVVSFDEKKAKLSFKWDAPGDVNSFTVVVAKDPNFTDIIATKKIKGSRVASLDVNHQGDTYWLVEGENVKERIKVRSKPGKFQIVGTEATRWDQNAIVKVGMRPVFSSYKTDLEDGDTAGRMFAGALRGRYWVNKYFGLGLLVTAGPERIISTIEDVQDASYANVSSEFNVLVRTKLFGSKAYHFDLIGSAGLRSDRLPFLEADETDPTIVNASGKAVQYLTLGLTFSRNLSETWLIATGGGFGTQIGGDSLVSGASQIMLNINLQQKVFGSWLLGYGYEFEKLSYDIGEAEAATATVKDSNAVEVSVGKGF